MQIQRSLIDLAFALLSAVLLVLSFPKTDLSYLAWVGLVPLLVALEGKGLGRAFLLAHVTGLGFIAGMSNWMLSIPTTYRLHFFLLAVFYLPLYVSLWAVGLNWVRRRTGLPAAMVAPPLWVTLEYVRSHFFFLAFPWALLGHSQYLHTPLIQVTSLTGVYGLTFLIVLTNAAIADAIAFLRGHLSSSAISGRARKFSAVSLAVAGGLLLATYLHGLAVLSRGIEGERITVALVQGNAAWKYNWDGAYRRSMLERYARLTQDAAQQAPTLIIWPESAVPGDVKHELALQRKLAQLAIDTKSHLLVGSSEYAKFTDRRLQGKYYNTMVLLTPEGRIGGVYRKIVMVPFAEYVPLRNYVRWPGLLASAMGNFLIGDQHTLFTVDGVTFGATLCWENIFPDLFREFVRRGARFMVNGTNDAWSGDTAEPYQHLAMNTFRAAENRVAIARATNAGITTLIDPLGRITKRLKAPDQNELFFEGILVGDILISRERTFYTRYGDVFAFFQIAASTLLLLGARLRPRSNRGLMQSG